METKPRKRAPGAGRPTLKPEQKLVRVVLFVDPSLASYLEAEGYEGDERKRIALRRKREAAQRLKQAEIASQII